MPAIKSHRQIWNEEFPLGSEWDAGVTPPLWPNYPAGRWTIRRELKRFTAFFHRFSDGKETSLGEFPPTEQGEIDAKTCAISARDTLRFS